VRDKGEFHPLLDRFWSVLTWVGFFALLTFDAYVLWWLFR
jgi:hypothetical protein